LGVQTGKQNFKVDLYVRVLWGSGARSIWVRAGPDSQGPSHHPSSALGQPQALGTSLGMGTVQGPAAMWACEWAQLDRAVGARYWPCWGVAGTGDDSPW